MIYSVLANMYIDLLRQQRPHLFLATQCPAPSSSSLLFISNKAHWLALLEAKENGKYKLKSNQNNIWSMFA